MSDLKEQGFPKSPPTPPLGARIRLSLMGAGVAGYGAVCGIGGGLFMTPILHYVRKLPLKNAVATSLALVSAATISATLTEMSLGKSELTGDRWLIVAALVVGSLMGAQVGFRVAKRINVTKLKVIFAIVLVITGLRLLFQQSPTVSAAGLEVEPGTVDLLLSSLVGFASGFLAPLLGIGGGLVAVPALFFGFPDLGYLGARACGMAMGACASTRSLWLYSRAGVVDRHRAVALAAGAAVGACGGVLLVHKDGAEQIAKVLMGVTLWIVAARFLWDVYKIKSAGPKDSGSQA